MVSFPCNTPCIAAETHRIRMQNFLANRSCPIIRYCQIKACVSNSVIHIDATLARLLDERPMEGDRSRKENVCLLWIQTGCWYHSPCLLVSQQFCHFVILSFCQREEGRGRKENVCLSRIQTGCWYHSPCLLVSQQFCHFVILSTGTITNRKVIAKYEQALIEAETTVDNIQDADLTVHDLVQIRERNYVSVELWLLTATSYRQHLQIIDEQLDAKKLLTHQQFQDQSDYWKSYASTSSVIFKVDLRSEITNQGYRICGLAKQIIISSSTIRYACNGDAVLTPKANATCEALAPPNRHIVLIGRRKPSVQDPHTRFVVFHELLRLHWIGNWSIVILAPVSSPLSILASRFQSMRENNWLHCWILSVKKYQHNIICLHCCWQEPDT